MTAKKLTVRRSRMGFSILDIMIALAIVGILASVYNFTMKWSRERAMVALFMADARQVKVAATRFFQDTGFFPPDVSRDVDPGLIAVDGWKNGGHSAKWDDLDLTDWRGPYLENWSAWKRNPWGGSYDWDNYEEGYSSQGIPGGNIYLTLKPGNWGRPRRDAEAGFRGQAGGPRSGPQRLEPGGRRLALDRGSFIWILVRAIASNEFCDNFTSSPNITHVFGEFLR
ncbi:MAG: type II secretion system GspH family protein [Deltaproteobacteria bacterium]|nr:type II secretion system GspH family protein [Deltaproteobacteria bacterium]